MLYQGLLFPSIFHPYPGFFLKTSPVSTLFLPFLTSETPKNIYVLGNPVICCPFDVFVEYLRHVLD